MFVHNIVCKKCSTVLGSVKLPREPDPKELPRLGKIGLCAVCSAEEKAVKLAERAAVKEAQNV